jgi:microcystin-dependent protein
VSEPFLSEIKVISWNFAPQGWAFCNGQFLPINQNQALFSLLGTTYGGNGQTTFALPNLRGRLPMHTGNGHTLGESAGSTSVTVNIQQTLPTRA